MKANLYEQFVFLKSLGKKTEAKAALDLFIASFESWEEKQTWVFSFLQEGQYGHKIRHEIYQELIYPVLLDGYLRNNVQCIVWLAKTASNLYEIKSLHPLLQHKTKFELLKEAYNLEQNEEIRVYLLKTLLNWFNFSQHEWPAGILYGMDGADIDQCTEILQEIKFARELDCQRKYQDYLSKFEARVYQYIERLQKFS